MDFVYKLYLERAENELNLFIIIQMISNDKKIQVETFKVKEDKYYSARYHTLITLYFMLQKYTYYSKILKHKHQKNTKRHLMNFQSS